MTEPATLQVIPNHLQGLLVDHEVRENFNFEEGFCFLDSLVFEDEVCTNISFSSSTCVCTKSRDDY